MRVVLDTSVLVSAFRSRNGASHLLLRAVSRRKLVAIATPPLFLQYEDVLKRSDQLSVSGPSLADVDEALAGLAALIEPAEVRFVWRPQLRDPGDELVLEAAVNGRVGALVTHNVRDFVEAAPRFGIRVARPGDIVQQVR